MRVQQCAFLVVMFLACLAEIRGFSMEEKCKLWAGEGYIGDPSDCHAWGFCQDNKLTARRSCSDGLLYNFRDGTCKTASEAMCHPQLSEICANFQPGDYVADPADCRRFVKCEDINNPIWSDCDEGQVFSNQRQLCLEEISGCPQDNICSYMKDGILVGDINTCRSYYKCHNGFGIHLNCSGGRYFNRKTGSCQPWLPDHCYNDEEIPPVTPIAKNSHMCSKYYQEDLSGVQLIPDMMTCYGYYACTSQYDVGQWSSCPWGQHFEWWSQRCGSPKDNSCSYDRCGNMNQLMVTTINTGCRQYTVCHDSRSKRSEKCPEDFPYFNEISQQCTNEFPNHRVCYMEG
ncbi:peritrophin-44 [Drosophila elegans]|uniref:peritrophin-44 n=1 Tax=Drosophila elegans TaxID=30023 RepID=UPI0007E83FE8|nr:peritrophin-44 [Drosophila elegans]